jgi:hypothetical protein
MPPRRQSSKMFSQHNADLSGDLSGPDFCFSFAPCGYDEPEILLS